MIPLAPHARQYGYKRMPRPRGDPLGIRGLPEDRLSLDALLQNLCDRLVVCGAHRIRGKQLADELGLPSTRALRLLVAYGRVHHHYHQIVGLPGDGYCWGDADPEVYKRTIADNERRARCHFFIAALHRRQGTAMAAVQLIFDFMEHQIPASRRRNDDLSALVAAEGVSTTDFLDAFISSLAQSDEGRATLAQVAAKHADILVPKVDLEAALSQLDQVRALLTGAARRVSA